jgi:fucose permease
VIDPSKRSAVWVAALVPFAGFFQALASFSLSPGWKERLELTDVALSLIWVCYIFGAVLALIVAPRFTSRFGMKPVILVGLSTALVGSLLLAVSGSAGVTAAGRFCAGLGTGVAASVGVSGVLSVGSGVLAGLAVSLASAATLLGAALGAAGSSLVIAWCDRPDLVIYLIASGILVAAILGAIVTAYPRALRTRDSDTSATARTRKPILPAILLQACVGAPAGVMLALGPVIVQNVSGGSTNQLGTLSVALFGGTFVGQVLAQRLPVALRRGAALSLTLLSCLLAVLAVPLGEPLLIVAAAALTGIGSAAGQMVVFAELGAARSGAALTMATSIGFLASYATNGTLPFVMGGISDATGDYGLAMLVLLAVIACLATAAWAAVVRVHRRARWSGSSQP